VEEPPEAIGAPRQPGNPAYDSREVVPGLGAEPGRLTSALARRVVADIDAADAAGFTIAEFIPRQVMHLQQLVNGFPLVS
jgi:arginase